MSAQTFATWRAVKNAWHSRDAEVSALQAKIDWLEGELSQFGQQELDLERVQAKLTEAEKKLALALEAMKTHAMGFGYENEFDGVIEEIEGRKP